MILRTKNAYVYVHITHILTHKERLDLRSQNTYPYAQGTPRFTLTEHIFLRTRNAWIYVHRTHILTHKERPDRTHGLTYIDNLSTPTTNSSSVEIGALIENKFEMDTKCSGKTRSHFRSFSFFSILFFTDVVSSNLDGEIL